MNPTVPRTGVICLLRRTRYLSVVIDSRVATCGTTGEIVCVYRTNTRNTKPNKQYAVVLRQLAL